jgi:acyl carrier protein
MKDRLLEKFRGGRPLEFSEEESDYLREELRGAMAVTLAVPKDQIGDDARVFSDLGLDSIDVFDVLDQLGEKFELQVALEELPNDLIRGGATATFRQFADGILDYFRVPPKAPSDTSAPKS